MSDDQKPTGPVRRPRPPAPPRRKFVHSKLPEGLSQREMVHLLFGKLRSPFRMEVLYHLARHPKPGGYSSAELQELLKESLEYGGGGDPMSTLWWENLLDIHEEEGQPPRFSLREKSPLVQLYKDKILSLFRQDPEEQEES